MPKSVRIFSLFLVNDARLRSNFKNWCFVFHQHSKTIKALGLRPHALISFLLFESPMKPSHSFLKYYFHFVFNHYVSSSTFVLSERELFKRSVMIYSQMLWGVALFSAKFKTSFKSRRPLVFGRCEYLEALKFCMYG